MWNETGYDEVECNAEWPGKKMKYEGDNLYSYTLDSKYKWCIFTCSSTGDSHLQTDDLIYPGKNKVCKGRYVSEFAGRLYDDLVIDTSWYNKKTRSLKDNKVSVSISKTKYIYDGKAKLPSVTVKYSNITLENGKDYKVRYTGKTGLGKAYVSVVGKGLYKGKVTKTYNIVLGNTSLKASSTKHNKIDVTCKKVKGATGYEVIYINTLTGKTITKHTTKPSIVLTASAGSNYKVKVRAYYNSKNVYYYGAFTKTKVVRVV